jgi:hypothetical protein
LWPFESGQRLLRRRGQLGQTVCCRPPKDVDVYLVVGMSEPVAHTADVGPRLAWHELIRLVAEPDDGFAHALVGRLTARWRAVVCVERSADLTD